MNKEKRCWVVYVHKIPKELSGYQHDKYYVGISSDVKVRWRKDGKGYKRKSTTGKYPLFWYAINKYGWDNIEHKILETDLTHDEACKKEKYYIKVYQSNISEHGYNLTDGGDGSCGTTVNEKQRKARSENMKRLRTNPDIIARAKESFRKTANTEAYKKMQSERVKELWNDPEYRKKCTGVNCHFSRDKYSFRGSENVSSKKVVCLNTGEVFDCVRYAQKAMNAHNICACCKGKILSSGQLNGVHLAWAYYDDYLKMSKSEIDDAIKNANKKHPCNEMKIVNIKTRKVYSSQLTASKLCGVTNALISYDCNKRKRDWMKYEEYCLLHGIDVNNNDLDYVG